MKRANLVIVCVLGLAVGLVLGRFVQPHKPAGPKAASERHYAINVANSTLRFWNETFSTGKRIGTSVPGVEVTTGGPTGPDVNKQIEELESLIGRKVNGVILYPGNKGLAPTIDKAMASGVPVVTLIDDVVGSKRLTFVGAPGRASAKALTETVMSAHPEFRTAKTKVLVAFPRPGGTVTDARLEGVKDVIESKEYRDTVELVSVVNDHNDETKAAEAIAAELEKHKDLKVIFGLDARSAIGAVSALKEKRKANGEPFKPGDVIVTAWDGDEDTLKGIEEGWIVRTSIMNSRLMTIMAFEVLEAHHFGYLYPEDARLAGARASAVPSKIDVPETLVDLSNVNGFLAPK